MLRITAVGAGAVEYFLRGCGCDPEKERALEAEREAGVEPGLERGLERGVERDGPEGYFGRAVEHGEPAGVWLGRGMEALGLAARAGEVAEPETVRAVFGQLRYPDSTERDPRYIGSKPRNYPDAEARFERLEEAAKARGETLSPERLEELRYQAASSGRHANSGYDFTYSPVKSVSVYYAALQAAGLEEQAAAVRAAHQDAVAAGMAYAESHIAMTRSGDHSRNLDGDRVGEFAEGTGLAAVAFGHSTNRESEPQLHTHVLVLNRTATIRPDGSVKIGALDSRGFRAFKEAFDTAYTRAMEAGVSAATGAVFETRPDGKAREIAGMDPALMTQASTRRSQVLDRVSELTGTYRARHGREPDPAARKAIADAATLQTRKGKDERAGPAGVAAWGQARRDWCERVIDQIDAAGISAAFHRGLAGHDHGGPGPDRGRERAAGPEAAIGEAQRGQPDHARRESGREAGEAVRDPVAAAVAAGVADVQARYPTWTLGNLAAAIDAHLPPGADLGVPIAERPARLEALARDAVTPQAGHDVVQLTGHEPVPVPASQCRASDGRPIYRPRNDERYATAGHLEREQTLVTRARGLDAPALTPEALQAAAARLGPLGLSADQHAAVCGVLGSGRFADVLIGPAGTGKSRTVAALAAEWSYTLRGRVFGLATSQAATSNLAHDGLRAINTTRFLAAFEPDPSSGQAREQLGQRDLVVIDEAGMSSTDELDRITRLVAQAGGKVLFTGDPAQLPAVGSGGMLAVLADRVDPAARHELDQPHRFTHPWEKAASLRVRDGDATVLSEYTARGRVHAGTLEEVQTEAARAYVTDRLTGRSSLLIVSSNEHAAVLSNTVRAELVRLGQVGAGKAGELGDGTELAAGDVVQARHNDYRIPVTPARDAGGRPGLARPVTNRELYTVLGPGRGGTLLVRDRHGATAALPPAYVAEHVVLGYAVTGHGAQGATVDCAHHVADRDATRESTYVGLSRGTGENHLYLATERDPDAHDPQRLEQDPAERFADILDTRMSAPAALALLEDYRQVADSVSSVSARVEVIWTLAARARHDATLERLAAGPRPVLDPAALARLRSEAERPDRQRLERMLLGAELDGHDPDRLLAAAVAARELHTADSVADVLRHRVRHQAAAAEPERDPAAGRWTQVVARDVAVGDDRGQFLAELAREADTRAAGYGPRVAETQPGWAVELLGPLPDPQHDPQARARWEQAAGLAAQTREALGIGDQQRSLGEAPAADRVVHRHLWQASLDAAAEVHPDREQPRDPSVRDWHATPDTELYQAREAWARTQEAGPRYVGDELAQTHLLAREYEADAARDRAAADAEPGSDRAAALSEQAEQAARFAEHHRARAAELEPAHQARQAWWTEQTPQRAAEQAAAAELERRGLPPDRGLDPQPSPSPEEHPAPQQQDIGADRHAPLDRVAEAERDAQPTPTTRTEPVPERARDLDRALDREATTHHPDRQPEPATATAAHPDPKREADRETRLDRVAEAEQRAQRDPVSRVDPDGARPEREPAPSGIERLRAYIREHHGDRLDPEHQLSDAELSRTRHQEIVAEHAARGDTVEAALDRARQALREHPVRTPSLGDAPSEPSRTPEHETALDPEEAERSHRYELDRAMDRLERGRGLEHDQHSQRQPYRELETDRELHRYRAPEPEIDRGGPELGL